MNFNSAPEFEKEYKKLLKKYKSLETDIKIFKQVIENLYEGDNKTDREKFKQKFFDGKRATIVTQSKKDQIAIKARLDCAYLNNDSLRIIFIKESDTITLIEIFNKSEKQREDKERIRRYL